MTATAPTTTASSSPFGFIAALAVSAALGLGAGLALDQATSDAAPATTVAQPANPGTAGTAGPMTFGSTRWGPTDVPASRFIVTSEPQLE